MGLTAVPAPALVRISIQASHCGFRPRRFKHIDSGLQAFEFILFADVADRGSRPRRFQYNNPGFHTFEFKFFADAPERGSSPGNSSISTQASKLSSSKSLPKSLTEAPVPAGFAYRSRLPRLRIQFPQKGSVHSPRRVPEGE